MPKRSIKETPVDLPVVPTQIIETVVETVALIVADPDKPEGLPPAELEPEGAPPARMTGASRRSSPTRGVSTRLKRLTGGEREKVASKARERRKKKTT